MTWFVQTVIDFALTEELVPDVSTVNRKGTLACEKETPWVRGGIGIHAGLRSQCRKDCGFESHRAYVVTYALVVKLGKRTTLRT